MASVVEIAIRGIDEATKVFDDVGSSAQKAMSQAESSINSVDDAINNVSDLEVDTGNTESAMKSAEQSVDNVSDSIDNVSDLDVDTGSSEASLEGVISSVDDVDASISSVPDLDIDTGNTQSAMDSATSSIDGVREAIQETESTAQSFGDNVSNVFQNVADKWIEITAVAGTAGIAIESMGGKQKDLTEQTTRVAQAMGTTSDEIRNSALEITNVTFPIEDALDLMETGRQQGIESTEQLKEYATFWDMVGDATGQAGPELGKASVGLRAVGISAGEESEALSAFGYITENTTGNVNDFLSFLERTGPQLNDMGMDVDDAAAMLGVLEHEFGMSGRTARQEFRKAVNEADGDMGALMDTLGVSDDVFKQYRDSVDESSDVIERNADIHAESYTVMDKLQQKASELMYNYGDFIGVASSLAPVLMALGPAIKAVSGATALFNATLWASPVTWIIAGIVALIAVIALLWANWDSVSSFLVSSWEWIKEIATVVFGAIGDFFSGVWEGIKSVTETIWNGIKEFFSIVWEGIVLVVTTYLEIYKTIISTIFNVIKTVIEAIWNGIKTFFTMIWDGIVTAVTTYINVYKTVVTTVFNVIKTVIETIWNGIKAFFEFIWNGIKIAVETYINIVKKVITTVFNAIKAVITTVWNTIKNVSTTVWNTIVSVVTGIINGFKARIQSNFNFIKNLISTIWNAIKNVSSNVWNGIRNSISAVINGIKNTVSSVFNTIKSTITKVWNSIKSVTSSVWKGMVGLVKSPIGTIIKFINAMINGINSIKIESPKIPDWVPKYGGRSFSIGFNIPNIPALATGGLVSSATLALIGEGRDQEAVLPLNDSVMGTLGSMIASHMGHADGNQNGEPIDYKRLAKEIADAIGAKLIPVLSSLSLGELRVIIQNMEISGDYDVFQFSRELKRLMDKAKKNNGEGWG